MGIYNGTVHAFVPLSTIVQNSPDNRAALSLMGYSAYYSGQFDLAFQM